MATPTLCCVSCPLNLFNLDDKFINNLCMSEGTERKHKWGKQRTGNRGKINGGCKLSTLCEIVSPIALRPG